MFRDNAALVLAQCGMKPLLKVLYRRIPFKGAIYHFVRAFGVPPHSVYKHLHFEGVFKVHIDDRRFFRMWHGGYELENELFWRGIDGGLDWERGTLRLWTQLCGQATCVLDIGANTGVYALAAKSVRPEAVVYAFEPVASVFQDLRSNCSINGYDILCVQSAVSDSNGKAKIYCPKGVDNIYNASVNKNLNPPTEAVIEHEVSTVTLATFIESHNIERIDLMKVDVETHEVEVLEGMGYYLDQMMPTMLIEVLTNEVGERLENLLRGKGYRYFWIDGNCNAVRPAGNLWNGCYGNYLVCTASVARTLGLA